MPRIIVTTEAQQAPDPAMLLDERIAARDLESDHFASQLIERIGWALFDADDRERSTAGS